MRNYRAMAWRVAKIVLAAVILAGVGWQFAKILGRDELWREPLQPNFGGLAVAGALYAVAFCVWGGFWLQLVRGLGEPLSIPAGAMAYFVSQAGKYVPGKALVIVVRVAIARAFGVRSSAAAITSLYETLTMMAAGALVGASLLPFTASGQSHFGWIVVLLLAAIGVPILPGVFNRLAARAARPFIPADAPPLPKLRFGLLLRGLAQDACGWFALGGSLLALIEALRPGLMPVSVASWLTCTAYVAVAYVVGFVAIFLPGGLGAREGTLQVLLTAEFVHVMGETQAAGFAVIVALLLRLLWTVVELILAFVSFLTFLAFRPAKVPA